MAACMITFPAHLYSNSFVQKVEHLSDWVVQFEAFASKINPRKYNLNSGTGAQVTEAFQDFDGQFFVKKIPHLYSITSPLPETVNYIFRLNRRKLHLEIPHMGPAETRTTADKAAKEHAHSVKELMCQPGPKQTSSIDF